MKKAFRALARAANFCVAHDAVGAFIITPIAFAALIGTVYASSRYALDPLLSVLLGILVAVSVILVIALLGHFGTQQESEDRC